MHDETKKNTSVQAVAARLKWVMDRQHGGNQSKMADFLGIDRQKVRKAVLGLTKEVDLDVVNAVASKTEFSFSWLRDGIGGPPEANNLSMVEGAESNATLIDMGTETIWVPLYPARLAAGLSGDEPLDIEPEGGFPLPSSFARRIGLQGNTFSAYVAGDSMRDDFDDGDVVFGVRQPEYDREAVYALYLDGGLLVKRVVQTRSGYDLVSTNPAYPPRPIASDDAYLIGRVVGALNRI